MTSFFAGRQGETDRHTADRDPMFSRKGRLRSSLQLTFLAAALIAVLLLKQTY
jgi:hypothetical protein